MFITKNIELVEREIDSLNLRLSKPQRKHLIEYLHGLITVDSGKKNVQNISDTVLNSSDQSNLNRFLTRPHWDYREINLKRIKKYAKGSGGYFILDDTNIEKTGKKIDGVGWLYDASKGKTILCHNLVTSLYINQAGEETPIWFHPYVKEEHCKKLNWVFHTKIELAEKIILGSASYISPEYVVFDAWYFAEKIIKACNEIGAWWVTRAKSNRKVVVGGDKEVSLQDYAKTTLEKDFVEIDEKLGEERYKYIAEKEIVLKNVGKVKIAFLRKTIDGATTFLVSNHLELKGLDILGIFKHRWRIDVMHRDCKQHLGLGDYQLRNMNGIVIHLSLVFLAYSLLKKAVCNPSILSRLVRTVGEACRWVKSLVLENFAKWVIKLYNKLRSVEGVLSIIQSSLAN